MTTKAATNAVTTAEGQHPFGELLAQYRLRKPGLSQRRLAELAGYDQAILVRMAQGKKDLTGPSGRERIIRLIETLIEQNAIHALDEANALLLAANLPPLFDRQPAEAKLIARFSNLPAGHRVRRTNLPAPLASFIGRAQEIADVRSLVTTARLVTLTGAGGAGKTRLAQRVASDLLLHYPEGVWYAELAALTDTSFIAETVARIFSLSAAGATAFDDLADLLRERHALLVLDNCEHLIDGAADFAQRLLGECGRLSILVTSREGLNVEGETTWRVPPMQPNEAAQLFVARALAARGGASLTAHDATVAQICRRLDGMPLAIELAAARLNTLSLSDIASRLDDRFTLLAQGRRGALPRHQTLRALIDWSHELLSSQEKIVFRRLGVFMGGWTLQTATQAVCDDKLDEREVLPLLSQLVRKSLMGVEERAGEMRYTFLETIRQYALEKLNEVGEMEEMHLRHAKAFEFLVWELDRLLPTMQKLEWHGKVSDHYANLRQAITWCFSSGRDEIGCSIIGGLAAFLDMNRNYLADSVRWSRLALQRMPANLTPGAQGFLYMLPGLVDVISTSEMILNLRKALLCYEAANDIASVSYVKANLGRLLLKVDPDSAEGQKLLEDARSMAIEAHSELMMAPVVAMQAHAAAELGLFDKALSLYRECLVLAKSNQDADNIYFIECFIATTLMNMLRFDEAIPHLAETQRLSLQIDDPLFLMFSQSHRALIESVTGDITRAVAMAERSLEQARQQLPSGHCKMAMAVLARVFVASGEFDRARALVRELLDVLQKHVGCTRGWYGGALDIAACMAGDAERAAKLFGAADEEYDHAHLAMVMLEAFEMEAFHGHRARYCAHANAPHITKARETLGATAFDAAYAEGYAMPLDQAVAYALGEDHHADAH